MADQHDIDNQQLIAVVGMALRFPGADTPESYWRNLIEGVESITFFDDEALQREGVSAEQLQDPNYVKASSVLADIAGFDAGFFGYTAREAQITDPQRRILLECAHEALEHAGYAPRRYDGRIGIYAGISFNKYLLYNLLPNEALMASLSEYPVFLANGQALTTTQISYRLGLTGPSLNVNTACSTSLVAIHEGCKSLLAFESDMALAGGATIKVPHYTGYQYVKDGMRAPDGHCRPFDADAEGTVFGNGAGMVLLKRFAEAVEDGDTIHAVIRGSAVNNDGDRKIGYTAPSVIGQAEVIGDAQSLDEIHPESITYIEAHGTGTALGDPIEMSALAEVFGAETDRRGFCGVGSVKSNLGHLDCAAGIAGFIKTVLALQHKMLPPSLNYRSPNPAIDFDESPFYVVDKAQAWEPSAAGVRRAGVSSFGIGGTNAHVILEEYEAGEAAESERPFALLPLAAKTAGVLEKMTAGLAEHLRGHHQQTLADMAYTLQVGRAHFEQRRFVVASSRDELTRAIEQADYQSGLAPGNPPRVVFMFPGQGSQYVGMGEGLYQRERVFRETLDQCADFLKPELGLDIRELLYPEQSLRDEAATRLADTTITQPTVFAVSYALAKQWEAWGITPDAVIGHSLGEFTAACLLGVFSLKDALRLVAARGRLIGGLPRGRMLAVAMSEAEASPYLSEDICLAAVNGPGRVVFSGPVEAIDSLAAKLPEARELHTSHAYHSNMMRPILADFRAVLSGCRINAPERDIEMFSTVTGQVLDAAALTDRGYWARQLVETVRFGDAVSLAVSDGQTLLLEVGPGQTLTALAKGATDKVVASMRHPKQTDHDAACLQRALGRLWLAGVSPDWRAYHGAEARRRVPMPTYPFERKRYWVDAPEGGLRFASRAVITPLPEEEAPASKPVDVPQASDTAGRIAAIWRDLLGVERPAPNDNFFELGGDSLIATQLLARLRESLRIDLSLNQFFAEPTIAALAALAVSADNDDIIPVVERGRPLPLSFAQQRLWFIDKLEGPGAVYNMPFAMRLIGTPDMAALEWSMAQIADRHEILRTTFVEVEGTPAQVAVAQMEVLLPVCDLAGLLPESGTEQERRLLVERFITEEARRPFDLEVGPLIYAKMLRLSRTDHVMLVNMHHIISDAWSIGVLVRELAELYHARIAGRPSLLSPPEIQYADFASWQRAWLAGDASKAQSDYWREALAGMPPLLELPTDRARPKVQTYIGKQVQFSVEKAVLDELTAFSRREDVTLFITLLSVFQTLLFRYTGQVDFAVGTPIANRTRRELEPLIGFFVNTLAMRAQPDGGLPFLEFLRQNKTHALSAYANQDIPFERVVEILQPERSLSYAPVFQVLFVMQNTPYDLIRLPGLEIENMELHPDTAMFDLNLSARVTADGLYCLLEYNVDLFNAATIERLITHFTNLLVAVPTEAARSLEALPMLGGAERDMLLTALNDTGRDYPGLGLPHLRFEEQARRVPEAVAVVADHHGETVNYGELNRRSNRLAHYLRSMGGVPDRAVGIAMGRSIDMTVALLGILKAGGAYVPLDPAYPVERLKHMLADARADLVLTDASTELAIDGPRIISLDGDRAKIAGFPDHNLDKLCQPTNLLYIIFTSGSTGRPKGIALSHGALDNLMMWHMDVLPLGGGVLQFASLSFDASFHEMFAAWYAGDRLYLIPEEMRYNALDLLAFLHRQKVAKVILPVVVLQLWAESFDAHAGLFEGFRHIITTGEQLQVTSAVRHMFAKLPNCRLHNHYGPAESHVVTAYTFEPTTEAWAYHAPIGHPIANTRIYMLDGSLNPTPPGVHGELYIAGANLARGYHGRPDLTAEKFVPDPFAERGGEGARLYKTGDLARYLTRGSGEMGPIEFHGRRDHMVKIRGFRIELAEIEAVLDTHPAVSRAVVLAHGETAGDKQLRAYIVAEDQTAEPQVEQLRRLVADKLPDYMVPGSFLFLESLPLTPNGKVDRRALEASGGAVAARKAFIPPRTEAEKKVASVYGEVLDKTEVGADDNFFELGGHSLLATQVVSRLRQRFDLEIQVRNLFEAPTVAGLAAYLKRGHGAFKLPPIEPAPKNQPAMLSASQQRLWFLDQMADLGPSYNIPAIMRLEGPLHVAVMEKALTQMLERHEALRTNFPTVEGEVTVVVHQNQTAQLVVVDLAGFDEGRVLEIARREGQRPFDIAGDRLIRFNFLRVAEDAHLLLVTMHHMVSDAWSVGIFIREMCLLYEALQRGETANLAALPLQYNDFAYWQASDAVDEMSARQLEYWRGQLAGVPERLTLPVDKARPAMLGFSGATRTFQLPIEQTRALQKLAGEAGATLFMTLLAVFQLLLSRYSGQDDVSVGSPIANRNRAELEPIIGYFVNTLVLRSVLDSNSSFRGLLADVRNMTLAAYPNQDVPFERLVEVVQPERNISHTPLYQAMFVLQNAPAEPPRLTDLKVTPLEPEIKTAQLELTLAVTETTHGLQGLWEYNTDLFEPGSIETMDARFHLLLAQVIARPETALGAFQLLGDEERRLVLDVWHGTDRDYRGGDILHGYIEAQALKTPERIAVSAEHGLLTYAELNGRAEKLASHLAALGIGVETAVAFCVPRCLALPVGMLALLKAGAYYVPLDLEHPKSRRDFMLDDSGAALLITLSTSLEAFDGLNIPVICLDEPLTDALPPVKRNLVAENLVYLMYTSGSTGKPKGSMNTHGAVVNHHQWAQGAFPMGPDDKMLLKASFCFDGSVTELFWPLMFGAQTVIARPDGQRDPVYLAAAIGRYRVTVIDIVPSMLHALLEAENLAECACLKLVCSGGEALSPTLRDTFVGKLDAVINNGYGPSETAIEVCCGVYDRTSAGEVVTLGRAIPNARLYVVDREMRPTPPGLPGELCIGGRAPGRGYHARPALTAEKFVPNPFGDQGTRLYRSGDLVRFLANGKVDFLGRLDFQVKIRGLRIETGEVETALTRHHAIAQTAVVVREDRPGVKQLVAYLAPDPKRFARGEDADAELKRALRSELAASLPDYMVPAAFVLLDALPLLVNGKLDRQALPVPGGADLERSGDFVAPDSPAERVLAGVWCEVLGLASVSIHDNFFSMGGDSILGIRIVARANRAGFVMTPRDIFQHQTIAELVEVLTFKVDPRAKVTGSLPLTPAQSRLLKHDSGGPADAWSTVRLSLPRFDDEALKRALAFLAEYHDTLRLRVVAGDAEYLDAIDIPLEVCEAIPHNSSFSQTTSELLWRVLADPNGGLLLRLHRAAFDSESVTVLTNDLEIVYRQALSGETLQLSEKTASIAAWSDYFRDQAASISSDAQSLWRALPDNPGDGYLANDFVEAQIRLDADWSRTLREKVAPNYKVTLREVLLAGLTRVLTEEAAFTVDLTDSARRLADVPECHRTVANLDYSYPVALTPMTGGSGEDCLKAAKDQVRRAAAHGLAFALIRQQEAYTAFIAYIEGVEPEPNQITAHHLIHAEPSDDAVIINWYSRAMDQADLTALAQRYQTALIQLLDEGAQTETEVFTPTDFPEMDLDQDDLDYLMDDFD